MTWFSKTKHYWEISLKTYWIKIVFGSHFIILKRKTIIYEGFKYAFPPPCNYSINLSKKFFGKTRPHLINKMSKSRKSYPQNWENIFFLRAHSSEPKNQLSSLIIIKIIFNLTIQLRYSFTTCIALSFILHYVNCGIIALFYLTAVVYRKTPFLGFQYSIVVFHFNHTHTHSLTHFTSLL